MSTLTDQSDLAAILRAIKSELDLSAKQLVFPISARYANGPAWTLEVAAGDQKSPPLRESLEGAAAWWPGNPNGTAEVLSVVPEERWINLRFATGTPPGPNETLFVYPVRYLEALERLWLDPILAANALAWLRAASNPVFNALREVSPSPIAGLRAAQKRAFRLPGWSCGFLWGPPGTGKTYTLGAMLASILTSRPASRVLLLSATNSAVDTSLIAVDEALEKLEKSGAGHAASARAACRRVGSHFDAKRYENRRHLLPQADPALLKELVSLEAQRPPATDAATYASWKARVDAVRAQMRQRVASVLAECHLAGMTTTSAAFNHPALLASGSFDLIVFDEASQVGMAHAIMLAPLSRHALFAGDPNQLSPVVQSKERAAERWLGDTPFDLMVEGAKNVEMLEEQSRMSEPVCRLVSETFYSGRLRVCGKAKQDPAWQKRRDLASVPPIGADAVACVQIERESFYSQKNGGPQRLESADKVADLVSELTGRGLDPADILVLTPFHAQRLLIHDKLKKVGATGITVSTVHRAQGGECHTVLFDPVDANSKFFTEAMDGRRLVNVALSRAMARLVLFLSRGDRQSRFIDDLARRAMQAKTGLLLPPGVVTLCSLATRPDFPACAVGKAVAFSNWVGIVRRVTQGGTKFEIEDSDSGQTREFITEAFRKACVDRHSA